MPVVHDPGNTNPRTEALYAILSVDSGGEGVMGAMIGGTFTALVVSEERHIPKIRAIAERFAGMAARPLKMRLVKFTGREDIEEFGPLPMAATNG